MNEEVMRFNALLREYEEVYRDIARRYAMPELSLWVLYVLCRKADCTQKDIADHWGFGGLRAYRTAYLPPDIIEALKTVDKLGYKISCVGRLCYSRCN